MDINLKLPSLESMERIRVRLNEPRIIEYKDGRKINSSQKTIIPSELQRHKGRKGIYLICKNNQVKYIGATTNFEMRMRIHNFLKKNPDIQYVFFLEEERKDKRLLFEMIYKYHYFGQAKWEYYTH